MNLKDVSDIATAIAAILGVLGSGYLAVRKIETHITRATQRSIAESKTIKTNMEQSFITLQTFNGERYREINQGLYELRQKYEQDLVRLGETDKELESIIDNLKKYVDSKFLELERMYELKKRDVE